MAQITYKDKVSIKENPVAEINKGTAGNFNEIKRVVNENDIKVGELDNLKTNEKDNLVNAINEINLKVFEKVLDTDTDNVTIDNLDILRDGGIYDIFVYGNAISDGDTKIKINDVTGGYYCIAEGATYRNAASSDLSGEFTSGYRPNKDSWTYGMYFSKDFNTNLNIRIFLNKSGDYPFGNARINSVHQGMSYEYNLAMQMDKPQNNISKISFDLPGKFKAGTRFIVKRVM